MRLIYALGGFGRFSVEMEVMSMFAGVYRLRNGAAVFSELSIGHFDNRTTPALEYKENFLFQYSTVKKQSRYRKRSSITTQ